MASTVSVGAIVLAFLALLSILLTIPPFTWHFRNRNIAACSLIFWVTVANLFCFINALLWPNDDISTWWHGQGLCDVEVKLTWGFSAGAAGSLTCIMQQLARIMDVERTTVIPTKAQRRRRTIVDLLWCFGCPIYLMAVDYIVQARRYYIFTIAGCTPDVDNSWLTIVLIFIWSPILCIIGAVYAVLVMYRLIRYRSQFSRILSSSNSDMSKSRFVRLLCISVILLVILLPVQLYILNLNLSYPRRPYNWHTVHGPGWNEIIMVPTGDTVPFDRWIRVTCGFILFLFFGTGSDATRMYRSWLIKFGFAKIFPRLTAPHDGRPISASQGSSSLGSRVKLLFKKDSHHEGGSLASSVGSDAHRGWSQFHSPTKTELSHFQALDKPSPSHHRLSAIYTDSSFGVISEGPEGEHTKTKL